MKLKQLFGILFAVLAIACLYHSPIETSGVVLAGAPAYLAGDKLLRNTKALPNGAAAVTSDAIDLGHGANGSHVGDVEFLLEAPAVTTAMLADAGTIKYDVIHSDNANLSSPSTIAAAILTQTGAAAAGAAAASARFRPPTNCKRYVGITATKSAIGDASTVSMTLSLKF